MPADLNGTPRQRIFAECAKRGTDAVIRGCADLLHGRHDDVDDDLIRALGGEPAVYVLGGGEGGKAGYWPRVWAARGLLHAWDTACGDPACGDAATEAIIHATSDDAWRVREMAGKVIARYRVGDALDAVAALRADGVPRVRAAAQRAVAALTAAGA